MTTLPHKAIAEKEMAATKDGQTTTSTTHSQNYTTNSASDQSSRLLAWLKGHGSITTIEARRPLDIMHPAMRVKELRGTGSRIDTIWTHQPTECGKVHRVAKYVLLASAPSLFDVGA
jgi:hypothetical protein